MFHSCNDVLFGDIISGTVGMSGYDDRELAFRTIGEKFCPQKNKVTKCRVWFLVVRSSPTILSPLVVAVADQDAAILRDDAVVFP